MKSFILLIPLILNPFLPTAEEERDPLQKPLNQYLERQLLELASLDATESNGVDLSRYEKYPSPQDVGKMQFGYIVSSILYDYMMAIYSILNKNDEGIGRNVIIDSSNIEFVLNRFTSRDKYPVLERVASIFEETIQAHSGKSLYTVAEALEEALKPYTSERIAEEFFSKKYKGEKVSEMTLKRWFPKPEYIAEAFLLLADTSDPNHPERIARLKIEADKKELQKKELVISSWLNGELASLMSWGYRGIEYIDGYKLWEVLEKRVGDLSKIILSGIYKSAHPLDEVKSIIRLNLERLLAKDPTPDYLLKKYWKITMYRKNTIASSIHDCFLFQFLNQKK